MGSTLASFALLLVLAVMACCFASTPVSAKDGVRVDSRDSEHISLTSDVLQVTVNGGSNVPKFTVRRLDGSNRYKVQFNRVFQSSSVLERGSDSRKGSLPSTDLALSSLGWTFTNLAQAADNSTMSFTMASGAAAQTPQFLFNVTVRNADSGIKWDTQISAFPDNLWHAQATHLALCYKLTQQSPGDGDKETSPRTLEEKPGDDGKTVRFGGARLDSEPTATAKDGKTIKATMKQNDDKGDDGKGDSRMACIYYEKFSKEMFHDPTFTAGAGALAARSTALLAVFIALAATVFSLAM